MDSTLRSLPALTRLLAAASFVAIGSFALAAAPQISYILPDIGAPGMNTYIEIYGPHGVAYSYGADGLYLNNPGDPVRVVCTNPADSARIVIGPCVVSWDGRMISTEIFVKPDQVPNSADWRKLAQPFRIPIRIVTNGTPTNSDTFYIVQPQSFGTKNAAGNTIGSGNTWGIRSRRGAMIVDNMHLYGIGAYSIDTSDCDPSTPGNQGFLPCVIMSAGPVYIDYATNLSVAAPAGGDAGPGGGGGGNGLMCGTKGGSGFTGGGGNGDAGSGCGIRPSGIGTGPNGMGLNLVKSGSSSIMNDGGGGGTGHPFGWGSDPANTVNGYGGGAPGPQCCIESDGGGGGGGYATAGAAGGMMASANGPRSSGGNAVGNRCIVPIAGGSGGGGGNVNLGVQGAGSGGGGGGALRIAAPSIICNGVFTASGGDGVDATTNTGGGGGGSGGAIDVEARTPLTIHAIAASGGLGGATPSGGTGQHGGDGAPGRARIDGPIGNTQPLIPTGGTLYQGPSIDTLSMQARTFTVRGFGNGNPIQLFSRTESSAWRSDTIIANYSGNAWSHTYTLAKPDTLLYVIAAQQIPNNLSSQYGDEPNWVMGQVSANLIHVNGVDVVAPAISTISSIGLSSAQCDVQGDFSFFVHNTGNAPLLLGKPLITGFDAAEFTLVAPVTFLDTVARGDSVLFQIHWQSATFGVKNATLSIPTNDTRQNHNPWVVSIVATHSGGDVALPITRWDLGDVCVGQETCIDLPIQILAAATDTLKQILGTWSDTSFHFVNTDTSFLLVGGKTAPYQLCYTASDTGTVTAKLVVSAPPCNRVHTLLARARGVRGNLTSAVKVVDFQGTAPGQRRDTVITFIAGSSSSVRVIKAAIVPAGAFKVDATAPPLPATIRAGDSIRVFFHFIATDSGNEAAHLTLTADLPCPLTPDVLLNGGCVATASVQIPSVSGNVGDTVMIPILVPRSASFAVCGAKSVNVALKYRRSLLVPVGKTKGVDSAGYRVLSFNAVAIASGDTALILPFIATLGDTDRTTLHVESFTWNGGSVRATGVDGLFTLSNVCRQGGSRYVKIVGPVSLAQNAPNPFSDETSITFELNEPSRARVLVHDMLGRCVAVVCDEDLLPGHYSRTLNAHGLTPGTYVCTMETPAVALRRIMLLER